MENPRPREGKGLSQGQTAYNKCGSTLLEDSLWAVSGGGKAESVI